ncbi:glycosyl hydrolase family 18 protein [Streptomyces sp. Y1]|uniref:Glycosyl hydrolase family 18 protein n=1 Tax=Streptomyces sp. Y1 TaxID=3238634 RepID=A0AB39TU38_9ACTN
MFNSAPPPPRSRRRPPGLRRTLATLLSTALLAAAVQTVAAPAQLAAADPNADARPVVISMGDSFISGEGGRWAGNAFTDDVGAWGTDNSTAVYKNIPRPDGSTVDTSYDPGGNRCDRSRTAEINGVRGPHGTDPERINLACSGATTDNIISADPSWKEPVSQADQLAAIAADKSRRIAMIVVSIGGNDIHFSDIIQACAKSWAAVGGAYCSQEDGDTNKRFRTDIAQAQFKVENALAAIRKAMESSHNYAPDSYQLVLQSYPNVLPPSGQMRYYETTLSRWTSGRCPFRNKDIDWARNSVVSGLSGVLQRAAEDQRATFLDLSRLFVGHELCNTNDSQASKDNSAANPLRERDAEWVRWIPFKPGEEKANWGSMQEAIHPNSMGQRAQQKCLDDVARDIADPSSPPSGPQSFGCMSLGPGDDRIAHWHNTPNRAANNSYGWPYYESLQTTSNPMWMNNVDDSAPLGSLSIPGSHETMSHYGGDAVTTQEWDTDQQTSLVDQLNAGIRAIDIRVDPDGDSADDKLWLWHGIMGQHAALGFGVLDPLTKWLDAHPTETVLLNLKTENTVYKTVWPDLPDDCGIVGAHRPCGPRLPQKTELSSAETQQLMGDEFQKYVDRYKQYFWAPSVTRGQSADTPLLGQVRGRIVLNSFRGPHGGLYEWGLNTASVDARVQNDYDIPTVADIKPKWDKVLAHLTKTRADTDNTALYVNYLSGASAGAYPNAVAGGAGGTWGVNHWAWDYFKNGDTGGRTGVLMMDYPGGELISQIIGHNTSVTLTPTSGETGGRSKDNRDWSIGPGEIRSMVTNKCLDVDLGADNGQGDAAKVQQWGCGGSRNQQWTLDDQSRVVNANSGKCLDVDVPKGTVQQWGCGPNPNQKWVRAGTWLRNQATQKCLAVTDANDGSRAVQVDCGESPVGSPTDAGDPYDSTPDDRTAKPAASGDCRPDGMAPSPGARYCDVYDGNGREWLGGRDKRVIGYFSGWRTGANGESRYLVKNIPWSKVSHVNYAFASVGSDNRITVGDEATKMTWPGVAGAEMDPSLPYQGHFNLLTRYKRMHPQVKTLISVGGWAQTQGFYSMATNADGSVNQGGINTFADSVVAFLNQYGFDGVDIDYEYPASLQGAGNPNDQGVANPRRAGLQAGYVALMKTLRAKLDQSGSAGGRYFLLTSAASSSGYLVRGEENQQALQYQDFVNVMSYDMHGSWNSYVGPQAPLYDSGQDNELAAAGIYNDTDPNTKDYQKTGYFNTDWAYHYYRGALQAGRINIGVPFYTRGWQGVTGGTKGLWGTAEGDQSKCQPGTGTAQKCGNGAVGIDNLWHDSDVMGNEVGAGSNPLWHAKNLQDGIRPGYLPDYKLNPAQQPTGYERNFDPATQSTWLWNDAKKVFISTEDDQSIKAKAQYIADNGIGGAMIWELGGDYTKRANGEWGMGYDMTTLIDRTLRGSGAPGAVRSDQALPQQTLDVKVELADYPSDNKQLWPMQPKLRITNNTGQTLPAGTEISFDIPTSTPPLLKDEGWHEMTGAVAPGRSGPNAGGLKADFHRVTIRLGYCEDLPAGKVRDIGIKYYLPITGPANFKIKVNGTEYGLAQDARKGTTPAALGATSASGCQAEPWDAARTYNPAMAPFALWKTGDLWKVQDTVSANVIDHPGDWNTAHLVDSQNGNANQLWNVVEEGGPGWFRIKSSTAGHDQCLGADQQLASLSVRDCDGSNGQWWQLLDADGKAFTGGPPKDGAAFTMRSYAGFVAEPKNSGVAPGTAVVAGDPSGVTRSVVSYNGYYWKARWWTKGADGRGTPSTDDPSDNWSRLGPTG